MIRRPPRSTRTDTLFPYTTLFRSLASFGVWTAVAVLIGKRWYRDYPVESSDPLLNDRAARLIGDIVVVTDAIENGAGRVRVGDGTWPAHGTDMPAGTQVRGKIGRASCRERGWQYV